MSDNNEPNLIHCIYASAETAPLCEDDILAILAKARKTNASLDVTGMLLYDNGAFFQVLEGEAETVEALLKKIEQDKRHDRLTRIIVEPIEERSFAEWSMGYPGITINEISQIEGLNDFFYTGKSFMDLNEGRAKKLLDAFKNGQWRATLR